MNNYLCYHVHQHSVQPIYIRQTPTVILQTQQRMPIALDLPPQNIILRNEEPQPIIIRQQNPNVMIQNESHRFQIDSESIDQINNLTNNNINNSSNINLSNEMPTKTTNFLNTFGNIVDTNPFDYKNVMNTQEQSLNQIRTMQPFDSNPYIQSQIENTRIQRENQGSVVIENGKEIGMAMGIIEGNKLNKIDNFCYTPKSNNRYNMYAHNNNNNNIDTIINNTPGINEMNNNNNTNNNNNNYNYSSRYPMMNYQIEQANYNSYDINNSIPYMSPISTSLPPQMPSATLTSVMGPTPISTNTNINSPYVNNPTSYLQNKNLNYVHNNENMNYYQGYKY